MSNRNVPGRPLLALLFGLALVAAWPSPGRAEEAEQPESGAAEATDDKPAAEGFAPEAEEAAAPTAARAQAMCARLGELMGKCLSYAERSKTAETRAALHCPPASRATQAAENPLPAKR